MNRATVYRIVYISLGPGRPNAGEYLLMGRNQRVLDFFRVYVVDVETVVFAVLILC